MIRVNLLYDISSQKKTKMQKASTASTGDFTATVAANENSQLMMKIFVFLLPVLLLIGYRWYSEAVAENDLKRLISENQALQTQLKSLDSAVKELEKFQEEKTKLNGQLQAIKLLSKERLKNVKSLDMLQTIIPSKAWLNLLKILDKNVEFEGFATDDLVISEFLRGLQTSIYFSNVKLVSSEEFKRPEGVIKKFKIKCNLENL